MGFIEDYLEYTKYQESPEIFHKWVAIGLLSSCLERSVWIDLGYWKSYPNLYILLIAGTAICRKSTSIDIGIDLLQELMHPPNIIESKITPAALIKRIAIHTITEEHTVDRTCTATIVASELANFLSKEKPYEGLIPLLTQLYDNRQVFEASTISRGMDRLKEPTITFIAASTLIWLRESMTTYGLEGGFTNRCNIIYRENTDRCVPRPKYSEDLKTLKIKLIDKMNVIRTNISGHMRETDEAKAWWDTWYRGFHASMQNIGSDNDIYHARKDSTLMKLAMIMSVSETDSMIVGVKHYESALKCIAETDAGIIKKTGILTKPTQFSSMTDKILVFIKNTKKENRYRTFIEKGLRSQIINISSFDSALLHLIKTKDIVLVRAPHIKNGTVETRYHLPDEGKPNIKEYFPEYDFTKPDIHV